MPKKIMKMTGAVGRGPAGAVSGKGEEHIGRGGERILPPRQGVDGARIILYLIAFLVIALILLNFLLPSVGVGGCIAVLSLQGEISTADGYGLVESEEFVDLLQKAEERPDVRGLIVEINSPGGSVVASREIYSALKGVNKTTVAYIADVGASGGYFVALGADHIMADPASITGSIGAIATVIDISRFLNKTGVDTVTAKSGDMKDIGSMFRQVTPEEMKLLENLVNEIFADFKNVVISERSGRERFTDAGFEGILDGRVLTGKQAYELGLVDELGTRQDARSFLGERVGLGRDPAICHIKAEKDFLSALVESMGRGIGEALADRIDLSGISSIRIS